MTEPGVRRVRADAVRNRAKILQAARAQITAHGPDVGMDQIAAAAGVAVGTLYRHFPTKIDLVAAVVGEFVAQVADAAEAAMGRVVEGGRPPFGELAGLLREIVLATADNRAVKAAAGAMNADAEDEGDMQRAGRALQFLIDSARTDATVRADLSIDDFYLLVSGVPADQPPAVLHRWAELTLFGIAGPAPDSAR